MERENKSIKMSCHCGRVLPRTLGGTLSAVLLVLMPKCPICLAGYVSVATGVGIGFTTAKYLRMGLIVVCVASLVWVGLSLWRRWLPLWRRWLPLSRRWLPLSRRWFGHHN